MINLIPPEGHVIMKREYFLRVGATLLLLFSGVAVLLAVAQIPMYVLIDAQLKSLDLEASQENKNEQALKDAESEVKSIKEILAHIKATSTPITTSMVIDEIENRAPEHIFFKSFYIDAPQGVIEKAQIQGTAPTRETLVQLKGLLEASDMFEKAEVPISDLARDTDLPFAITVTLKKNK